MIDRQSPVPYYEQLVGILRERIERGELREGDWLPSESELCREYGLSRATVRQASQTLVQDGVAERVPRRGLVVTAPRSGWILQDQEGFLESQLSHGVTGVSTRVVRVGTEQAPEHVASALGIRAGSTVHRLERVRSLHGQVALWSTNWLPADVAGAALEAPGVLDGSGSLNAALREAGLVVAGARRTIEARALPEHTAVELGAEPGRSALRVRSVSWERSGRPFDYYETWVLTDVVPLEVNVTVGAG